MIERSLKIAPKHLIGGGAAELGEDVRALEQRTLYPENSHPIAHREAFAALCSLGSVAFKRLRSEIARPVEYFDIVTCPCGLESPGL